MQEELANSLGVRFFENTYSFVAVEVNEDATKILSIIGLCQFELSQEGAVIRSIAAAPDKKEDEAVFIMVRTVMNFCYRAEIPTITLAISDDSADLCADSAFVSSLGFRAEGSYTIDLKKFYKSPCHYEA